MAINRAHVLERLKQFIATDVLDGKDVGLDYETPLLEWGVINSFELTRLIAFIRDELEVDVPLGKVKAEHFKDINALADLIVSIGPRG